MSAKESGMYKALERKKAKKRSRHERWEERQDRSRGTREEHATLVEKIAALRENIPEVLPERFSELPLSGRTQLGLERGNFKKMTAIQQESLYYTLTGRDVLGAAKTGSGKTLCFIIPVLERLFHEKWAPDDGLGALVLTPTRELALQIFKVLQVVGYKHTFSAALLTGGRDVREERKRIHAISIVIGTPGRILQHLTENSGLVVENLQVLVMDEADRLLDMGFRDAVVAILGHLNSGRQTLLFSATQTQDVRMLADMSLKNPKFIAAHAASIAPTPSRMCQNFLVIELHRKLDALLMFIKRHPSDKTVVFISTCNQVKFMYLAFSKILKKMRVPSMCLTGKMKQFRREEVFLTFCRCKSAVLFCTDIAARGLDFPMVHWVIQYDCPESPQTYIHRVGRTARAGARGAAIMFLTPRETPMLNFLHQKKLPLREIAVKSGVLQESKQIFVALVVQGLKYEAQKAFTAYLRSLHFAANKAVFDFSSVDLQKFAHSLGLLTIPNTAEINSLHRSAKNVSWDVLNFIASNTGGSSEAAEDAPLTRREKHLKAADMFRQLHMKQERYGGAAGGGFEASGAGAGDSNSDGDAEGRKRVAGAGVAHRQSRKDDDDDDDELFTIQRRTLEDVQKDERQGELTFDERMAGLSKSKIRRLVQEADLRVKDLGLSKRTVFDAADADDEEEEEGQQNEEKGRGRLRVARAGAYESAVIKRLDGVVTAASSSSGSDVGSGDELAFEEKLRSRVLHQKEEDTARQKALRRRRLLKRAGRLDDAAAPQGSGGGGGGGDAYDSSSSLSYDEDTQQLLRAARGEMTWSDDEDENDGGSGGADASCSEADDSPAEVVATRLPKRRARK